MASYPQYRAPRRNDQALVEPGWVALRSRLAEEPDRAAHISFGGVALQQLRTEARRNLVAAAIEYTARYSTPEPGTLERINDGPLIVSGHQPELFHPGVWFKNFALDSLAKASGGVGVHLLIDSDLCRETSIRVPTGSIESPRVVSVAYDRPQATTPHEQRQPADLGLLDSFADRLAETVRPLIAQPLVEPLWHHVRAAAGAGRPLGAILSEGRHRIELEWGSQTLELPMSEVADSEPFRRFAAELLVRGPQVAAAYNGALAEYRVAHKLRSAAQPLPDLSIAPDWCETPFWVWSDDQPTRRPLFARHVPTGVEVSNQAGWSADGPATSDGLSTWLSELSAAGIKVRSRALVTTLYARLVLSDLFLHGIGGAKYDQVTDRFAERLFGESPPPHATLTATLRLPIEHDLPDDAERLRLTHRLRQMRYHPEHFLPADAMREAAERKARWIEVSDPAQRHERHQQITRANQQMYEALGDLPERTRAELMAAEQGVRRRAILESREYSFCLFPEADLHRRLTALSQLNRNG